MIPRLGTTTDLLQASMRGSLRMAGLVPWVSKDNGGPRCWSWMQAWWWALAASMVVGLGSGHGGGPQRRAVPMVVPMMAAIFVLLNPLLEAGIVMPRLWSCDFQRQATLRTRLCKPLINSDDE